MKTRSILVLALTILLSSLLTNVAPAAEPTFDYETLLSGYYLGYGHDMEVDAFGNAYVIASWYQDQHTLDILVFKLDPDGTPLWTLPIVGESHDYAADIALDAEGNVWVTGWTDSEDFPIVDGLDDTLTGFRDAFIMKLDPEDGTILYSTFLGGDYVDDGRGIAFNDEGDICVMGSTISTDFPTTPDAYQSGPSAPLYIYADVFITKLSPAGDAILYSTYFGGFEDEFPQSLELDGEGNYVFAGKTNADDFPLANPIQSDPNEMFVSKLSADGSTLLFSTYFGGEDLDGLGAMALDTEGNAYLTGYTRSVSFPTTAGAFQETFAGEILGCETVFPPVYYNCEDVFVTKMATDGSGLVYSTYLGGSRPDFGRNITVDDEGRAYVVGHTSSYDFPPDGIDDFTEIFVSRIDPTGSILDYSYIIPSSSPGSGHGIAVDMEGGVYLTAAVNIPYDIYVAKIQPENPLPDIAVSISSSMTQVPRNSNFFFDVSLMNNEATPQTLTGWTAGRRLPGGTVLEPFIGPVEITLQPGEARTFTGVRQHVGPIPTGDYRYFLRIGESFPGPVWHEGSIDLEVIP
jgi:hypothetical protein